jgi:hypothetical protein
MESKKHAQARQDNELDAEIEAMLAAGPDDSLPELSVADRRNQLLAIRRQWSLMAEQAKAENLIALRLNDEKMQEAVRANMKRALIAIKELNRQLAELPSSNGLLPSEGDAAKALKLIEKLKESNAQLGKLNALPQEGTPSGAG